MKKTFLSLCGSLAMLGCGAEPMTDPDLACGASPTPATLATNVQAVFTAKCATCHFQNYSYGDFSDATRTAASTVNKKSLFAGNPGTLKVVEPLNLANSALWLKVLGGSQAGRSGPKGENVSSKMPNDDTTLTADEKQLLKDWICGGAK